MEKGVILIFHFLFLIADSIFHLIENQLIGKAFRQWQISGCKG